MEISALDRHPPGFAAHGDRQDSAVQAAGLIFCFSAPSLGGWANFRVRGFEPYSAWFASLVNVGVLVTLNVIVTDAYRKRISQSPLHHSALHSDRDLRMGFRRNELRHEGINFAGTSQF